MEDRPDMTSEELLTALMRGEQVTERREAMHSGHNETGKVITYNARHGNILQVEGRNAGGITYVGYWDDSTGQASLVVAHVPHGGAWAHVTTHSIGDISDALDFLDWASDLTQAHVAREGRQQYARSEDHITLDDVRREGESWVWEEDDAQVRYTFIHGTKNMYSIEGMFAHTIFTGYWDAMEGMAYVTAGDRQPFTDGVDYADDGVQHVHVSGELYTPQELIARITEKLAEDSADLAAFVKKSTEEK